MRRRYRPQNPLTRKRRPEWLFLRAIHELRKRAMARRIVYTLSDESAVELLRGDCVYCGAEPAMPIRHQDFLEHRNTIDRVDSAIGYEPGNCVSCCLPCNWAKNSMSQGDFVAHVSKIARHLKLTA